MEQEAKWRAFLKRWQLIVGRAKHRNATKEELDTLCEALKIVKKYRLDLFTNASEEELASEVEG